MNRTPTVLIVDDDQISLSLLTKLVEKTGNQVITAPDAIAALGILKAQAVELVIADYEMPGYDGLELLKQTKLLNPRLPFILVTAYSNLRVIREAWEFGAFDFFQKPVFVDRLNQTIKLAIEYGDMSISRRVLPNLSHLQPDPKLLDSQVVSELAVNIQREDLRQIADEFETHARIELEQLLRFSLSHQADQVRMIAHRLAGSSVNLGVARFADEMRAIESKPEVAIRNGVELGDLLETSIYGLELYLADFYRDLSA